MLEHGFFCQGHDGHIAGTKRIRVSKKRTQGLASQVELLFHPMIGLELLTGIP
jgi:hypothetical protein